MKLPRNTGFLVHELEDGRKIAITTDGRKQSYVDGKPIGRYNIRIWYQDKGGRWRGLSYIEDVLVDLMRKRDVIGDEGINVLIEAIKESIELVPVREIFQRHPELRRLEEMRLPGHPIELLLVLLKWAGVEEDVNYWGINPKTNRPYEGRYKPYNAICDLFVKKMRLADVIRKHKLV